MMCGALVLLCSQVTHAIPSDAIAWWRFDPTRFASTGASDGEASGPSGVLVGGLRAAVSSGLFGDGAPAAILEGLLAAGEVGEVEHTLCLMEFKAHRDGGYGTVMIDGCKMVLELHTDEDHGDYLRTLRAIVVDADRAKNGDVVVARQRRLELPGGYAGVAYKAEDWKDWREVSWASLPGRFLVGLGPGALERWLEKEDAEDPAWRDHKAVVDEARPDGEQCLQAYFDLDRLSGQFSNGFAGGRTGRMRTALELDGASEVMLHARFVEQDGAVPALLAIDITVAEGREGLIDHRRISESYWAENGEIGLAPPGGSYIIAARMEWETFFPWAMNVYSATVPDADLTEFNEERGRWEGALQEKLDAVLGSFRSWLVVSDVPAPEWSVPGLATVFVPARSGVRVDRLEELLLAIMRTFPNSVVMRDDPGGLVWSLKIDRRGIVQLPYWGMARGRGGAVLLGGWSKRVIDENRRTLAPGD